MKPRFALLLPLVLLFAGCSTKIQVQCIYPNTTWDIEIFDINTWIQEQQNSNKDFDLWCDDVFEWECLIYDDNKIKQVRQKAEPKKEYDKILKNLWYMCDYIWDEQCRFYWRTAWYPKYDDMTDSERLAHFYARYKTEWNNMWCRRYCNYVRPEWSINNNGSCKQMCEAYY